MDSFFRQEILAVQPLLAELGPLRESQTITAQAQAVRAFLEQVKLDWHLLATERQRELDRVLRCDDRVLVGVRQEGRRSVFGHLKLI